MWLSIDVSIEYRSINGVQNFAGYLEYFDLGNSSANSETSDLKEDDRLILVRFIM